MQLTHAERRPRRRVKYPGAPLPDAKDREGAIIVGLQESASRGIAKEEAMYTNCLIRLETILDIISDPSLRMGPLGYHLIGGESPCLYETTSPPLH